MIEKKKVLMILLIAGSLGLGATNLKPFTPAIQLGGDLSVDKMRQQNLAVVKKAVEGLRENLPQKVDNYTTLVGVDSNGTQLIYTFEVNAGPKSDEALKREGVSRIAPRVRQGICRDSQRFLQAGIDISYRYRNAQTKGEILRVDVGEKDCPALKKQ